MTDAATTGAASDVAIQVERLTHRYPKSKVKAVDGATFEVPRGAIHGFVGPNGAGKTTTLKVLATLLKPQAGKVRVFGHDVVWSYKRVRTYIGYMPDHFGIYRQMSVREYLDFFAAAYGMPPARRRQTIGDVLGLTDMEHRADHLLDGLSRGLQQRVSLARVLVHDPRLLLLDEPASGLDPRARIELMEILRELARLGKTIFISSHILSELEDLCTSVTILDRGSVKFSGPIGDLLQSQMRYVLQLEAESPALLDALAQLDGATPVLPAEDEPDGVAPDARIVTVDIAPEQCSLNAVLAAALACGAQIAGVEQRRQQLDQAFMALTEPGVGE